MTSKRISLTQKRIQAIKLIVSILFLVIIFRLAWVQFVQADELQYRAKAYRVRDLVIEPKRGMIYDSQGTPLALSVSVYNIAIDPTLVSRYEKEEEIIEKFNEILDLDLDFLKKAVEKKTQYVLLKSRVPEDKTQEIRDLKIPGIIYEENVKRFYPQGRMAAHILGITGEDNQGLEGVELFFNEELKGVPGKRRVEIDGSNRNREIPNSLYEEIKQKDGNNLYLTINENIQYIAERELEKMVTEKQAKKGVAVVMDVKTGEILAMASSPSFDPNNFSDSSTEDRRNIAITNAFEPGSTFKTITAAAFLEENIVTPEKRMYCAGYVKVGSETMRCWKHYDPHGSQSFTEGVQNSCNPVFIVSGIAMGKDDFYKYLKGFGFGRKTGIDLPGESLGILVPENHCKDVDLASMSMGQANAVTPLQLITALSAVANDGYLMKPQIIKEIRDSKGELVKKIEPEIVRQVISKETSKKIRLILESVVSEGTGRKVAMEGYKIAGKTGTAQKILPTGGYSRTDFIASFAGFAPADDPQIACIVAIDSPKGIHFGGTVAGPVFKTIVQETLRYRDVPIELDKVEKSEEEIVVPEIRKMEIEEAKSLLLENNLSFEILGQGSKVYSQLPEANTKVNKNKKISIYTRAEDSDLIAVPELKGLTIREASLLLNDLGLTIVPQGSGVSVKQNPDPGVVLQENSKVYVDFYSIDEWEQEQREIEARLEEAENKEEKPDSKEKKE